jgi:hypothetical protein
VVLKYNENTISYSFPLPVLAFGFSDACQPPEEAAHSSPETTDCAAQPTNYVPSSKPAHAIAKTTRYAGD